MLKTQVISAFTALAISFSAVSVTAAPASAADSGTMRDISTFDIVKEMGIGINLGNTFESSGDWIWRTRLLFHG